MVDEVLRHELVDDRWIEVVELRVEAAYQFLVFLRRHAVGGGRRSGVQNMDAGSPTGGVGGHVSSPVSGTVETSDEGDDRPVSKSTPLE